MPESRFAAVFGLQLEITALARCDGIAFECDLHQQRKTSTMKVRAESANTLGGYMKISLPLGFVLISLLVGCNQNDQEAVIYADRVFMGDHIITMDGLEATAVALRSGRISFVGSKNDVTPFIGPETELVELGNNALLPGFIDAHGHFSAFANRLESLDLSSPPVGGISSIDDIVESLRSWIEVRQIPAGERVTGFGYDDSLLLEQRHPTRQDLDRASSQHPIVIRHVSGHLLVANSAALEIVGVSALTADPAGGVIRRQASSNEPDGVMEETAMGLFSTADEMPSAERRQQLRRRALNIYASYGVTTIQDSNVSPQYFSQLVEEAEQDPFSQDIVAYVWVNGLNDTEVEELHTTDYIGGIRLGGAKFTLDGSPQGRTAWLSEPYTEAPPGQPDDYVAYPSYDPALYRTRLKTLVNHDVPVLAHANGDAAIDLMLDGLQEVLATVEKDHRSVAIHAQLMRPDQLPRVKQLGVIASYYSVHPYFWGDWHRLSFGEQRAAYISPVADTLALEIPVTIHNDTPVVPPDMMRLVGITVNRETRSGYVLGANQRATVEQALYAITQSAAYQYFEEDEKGSITLGKQADLVILEADPRLVEPRNLSDLKVLATYARGELIYRR